MMQLGMPIDRRLVGEQRAPRQLACVRSLSSYRQLRASRIYSVSGSRVHGWHPPQQEQQLPPPHAVAAPEVLPATDLEAEQQQQEGAAPHVPRDNAYVRRKSQERVRMARDLGLDRTAAPGSSSNGSSSSNGWLELSDAAVAPAATDESAATADQAEEALADVAAAPRGEAAPASAAHTELLPKGWAAAAAPPAVVAEDITAAATAVDSSNGTTTYSFNTSSSSSVKDSRPKIFDSAVGTAVDCEAAAAATMAAANSAAATAAAANVASVESSWLYDQERQPLQVPKVQVVRMELARSPDGAEPAHFYMPDPLCIPCMCVEAGQQQEVLQQAYNRQLVAACWRQAGRVAAMDQDPEEEGFVLLDYEEEEHQIAELHQQTAAPEAAADVAEAAAVAADATLDTSSSSSSNGEGETVAAAAAAAEAEAEAQQQPAQQQPQQEVQTEMATVEFCFRCVTQPGERLWLVGDGEALGNWDASRAAKMKWSEGHTWSVSLPFTPGTKVTYKAVLQLADKEPKYWRWQGGPNCAVEVRSSSDNKPMKVKHDFK